VQAVNHTEYLLDETYMVQAHPSVVFTSGIILCGVCILVPWNMLYECLITVKGLSYLHRLLYILTDGSKTLVSRQRTLFAFLWTCYIHVMAIWVKTPLPLLPHCHIELTSLYCTLYLWQYSKLPCFTELLYTLLHCTYY